MVNRFVMMVVISLSIVVSSVRAQDNNTPIIAVSKGDIYTIDPTTLSIKQVTKHPSIAGDAQPYSQRDLAISPDGHYLAYRQTPRFFQVAMKNNLIGNFGETPSDIVLLDLTTGAEKVIATQQTNVSYSDGLRLWYRSDLVWSPDGSQLAYNQTRGTQGQTNYQAQLMLYDPAAETNAVFVDSKEPLGKIAWLYEGIEAGTSVWDIAGGLIVHNYLYDGMVLGQPMRYDGNEYVIVDSADVIPHDKSVYVMDILTGQFSVIEGYQSSTSAVSPDNSLLFIKDDNDTRPWHVINFQNGGVYSPPTAAPYAVDFTFSPDGQQFAYSLLNTNVNISDMNGNDRVVKFKADTILWSAKQYTVSDIATNQAGSVDLTDDFDNSTRCGTVKDVGLEAGGQGKMIGGGPNRIRSTPATDAKVVGQIPEGGTFDLVDGQQGVCSGAIRWVQVKYQDVTGWTAEGADGKAFLEPVQ